MRIPVNRKRAMAEVASPRPLIDWWNSEPAIFDWKQKLQQFYGGGPDLFDPNYDYDKARRSGVGPEHVPYDPVPHWPSQFKGEKHPDRFIQTENGLFDTLKNEYVR